MKNGLFANLEKCRFHQDKVRFLGYVVSGQGIKLEGKRIEAVKNWPEPKPVRNIQVFIGFANFYCRFIQGFGKIAAPLTSILKTTGSVDVSAPISNRVDVEEVVGGAGGVELSSSKKTKLTKSEN